MTRFDKWVIAISGTLLLGFAATVWSQPVFPGFPLIDIKGVLHANGIHVQPGSSSNPSVLLSEMPGDIGLYRPGANQWTLTASQGLGNQAYDGQTYLKIDGIGTDANNDGSGYMFWVHGRNSGGGAERPYFQIRRDGGTRVWDYFMVMPASTSGAPNWNWPGTDSANLVVGTDVVGPQASSVVVYGLYNPLAPKPSLLRLYGSVTLNPNTGQFDGTNVYDVDDNGVHLMHSAQEPAAPPPQYLKLFAKDNGAGKMQLAVKFPSGAVAVLAAEP